MLRMAVRERTLCVAPWFLLEALVPDAALFVMVAWLSLQFLRDGFADTRQHVYEPAAALGTSAATMQKRWWSCTCALTAAGACVTAVARGLRQCCRKEKARVTAGFFGELATVIASTRL